MFLVSNEKKKINNSLGRARTLSTECSLYGVLQQISSLTLPLLVESHL